MYGYVYLTTNLINGKRYIGRHKSETFDEGYKGSGILLHRAFDKYGSDNFKCEILCECASNDELNEQEKHYIELFDAVNADDFYNIAPGGQGGDLNSGRLRSEEFKRKISQVNRGKIRTEKWRREQSERMKGNTFYRFRRPENMKWSEEQYKIMSEKLSGQKNPMYGKPSWNRGIPMSEEAKQHLSEVRRERNIPSSIRGRKALHKNGKTVYVFPEQIDEYIAQGYEAHGAKRNRNKKGQVI